MSRNETAGQSSLFAVILPGINHWTAHKHPPTKFPLLLIRGSLTLKNKLRIKQLTKSRISNMAELTLRSPRQLSLKPLVQAALQNELRLLQAGIQRSQKKLQAFEGRYGFATDEFLQRYENNQIEETLELAEWIGEYRMWERLREKAQGLREVQFAD